SEGCAHSDVARRRELLAGGSADGPGARLRVRHAGFWHLDWPRGWACRSGCVDGLALLVPDAGGVIQEAFFLEEAFFFFGTLAPLSRASDNPIAIACLRLLTVLPLRPLFSVPFFFRLMALSTLLDAFLEYFLAMGLSSKGAESPN